MGCGHPATLVLRRREAASKVDPVLQASCSRPSLHLPELRKGLDQPQRCALKPAGEEGDAGRDEEHADRLFNPAELFFDDVRNRR